MILKFSCPNKYRGDKCQKLLESFKKRELKSLISQAQNSQCNNFQKRCLNLITDSVLAKMYKKSDKEKKESPKYIIHIQFGKNRKSLFILIPFCMKMT